MTIFQIALLILSVLVAFGGWYIGSHRTDEPHRKRRHRRARPATKAPAYEPDDGPLTAKQIKAIKRIEPQGRMKSVKSRLF